MKTLCSKRPIFSDDSVTLSIPLSWDELTQEQLRYVLTLMSSMTGGAEVQLKTYALIRFAGVRVVKKTKDGWHCCDAQDRKKRFLLTAGALASMIEKLDYLFEDGACTVRLERCQGRKAVDAELHGVALVDYIVLENWFQQFIEAPEEMYPLMMMANILYPREGEENEAPQNFEAAELYGVFLWFRHVKALFAEEFPNLFRPASGSGGAMGAKERMNAMLRALTDGDVTKEEAVEQTDVWRALTELDAKAKDADELKRQTRR